jgi:hypothetical protein
MINWTNELKIKSIELCSSPILLKNVFCRDTINDYLSLMKSGTVFKKKAYNYEIDPQLEFTLPKIQQIIKFLNPNYEVQWAHFLKELSPYLVHTDTTESKNYLPYKVIMMPLEIEGESTHTVFFNQRYLGPPSAFMKGTDLSLEVCNTKTNYEDIEKYENGGEFSQQTHLDYLDHIPPSMLQGLSIDKIVEWRLGDLIIFDSCQLHCSSSFQKFKVKSKSALVIFTHIKVS